MDKTQHMTYSEAKFLSSCKTIKPNKGPSKIQWWVRNRIDVPSSTPKGERGKRKGVTGCGWVQNLIGYTILNPKTSWTGSLTLRTHCILPPNLSRLRVICLSLSSGSAALRLHSSTGHCPNRFFFVLTVYNTFIYWWILLVSIFLRTFFQTISIRDIGQ